MCLDRTQPVSPRIMMYSQDGFGLGHMRRTTSIARQVVAERPDAGILTIADSRLGQFFESCPTHDYLKLPSVLKAGPGDWRAVSLPLSFGEIRAMRQDLIRCAALSFQPHLLLVDHMPHGAMGELLPTLEALKASRLGTRIVLGLRDILDAPEVIRQRWQVEGAYAAIEHYYDKVLVYGKRELFDLAEQYSFPPAVAERLDYCGYVCTPETARYSAKVRTQHLAGTATGTRLIVAMAGGGADAYPMMRALLDALPAILQRRQCVLVLITGPFMPPPLRHDLERCARGLPVRVRPSVSDTLSYIDAADLVVAMAGYNTSVEILRSGKPAILIPRSGPSAEQRLRAGIFSTRGWVDILDPDDLDSKRVAASVVERLRDERSGPKDVADLRGLWKAAKLLLELLPPLPDDGALHPDDTDHQVVLPNLPLAA